MSAETVDPVDELAGKVAAAIVASDEAPAQLTSLLENHDAQATRALVEVTQAAIRPASVEEVAAAQQAMAEVRATRFPGECPTCGEAVLAREVPGPAGAPPSVVLLTAEALTETGGRDFLVLDEIVAAELPPDKAWHQKHVCLPEGDEG